MYNINVRNMKNIEPWNIDFFSRQAYFYKMVNMGYKVNVILYEKADPYPFRYRVYNIYQNLNNSKLWQAIYFFDDELNYLDDIIKLSSMVTIVRLKWNTRLNHIIYIANINNKPVIFDIDDFVCKLKYLYLVTNTIGENIVSEDILNHWISYMGGLELSASQADGFTVTNEFLGDILTRCFGKPYRVIPNFLNEEQIYFSKKCLMDKMSQISKKPFIIGYFSGTPSHKNDFDTIKYELIDLLNEFSELKLKIVGFMELSDQMMEFFENKRIIFEPLVDFITLQRFIASVDVNIVPLVKNDFTDCKSELKFFEAAIVKTITCASPSYTYKSCIKDGETGFLCQPGMWYEKIRNIYLNKVDINSINNKAYDYVNQFYYGKYITQKIEDAYNFFVNK